MLDGILERHRPQSSITYFRDPATGTPISESDAVLQAVSDHFQTWFTPRVQPASILGSAWEDMYHPLEDLNPSVYDHLMDPPTAAELKRAFARLPNKKSGDPQDIPTEYFSHMGT